MTIETMPRTRMEAFRGLGWRVYDSESTEYDYLMVREDAEGKTVTRKVKVLPSVTGGYLCGATYERRY